MKTNVILVAPSIVNDRWLEKHEVLMLLQVPEPSLTDQSLTDQRRLTFCLLANDMVGWVSLACNEYEVISGTWDFDEGSVQATVVR